MVSQLWVYSIYNFCSHFVYVHCELMLLGTLSEETSKVWDASIRHLRVTSLGLISTRFSAVLTANIVWIQVTCPGKCGPALRNSRRDFLPIIKAETDIPTFSLCRAGFSLILSHKRPAGVLTRCRDHWFNLLSWLLQVFAFCSLCLPWLLGISRYLRENTGLQSSITLPILCSLSFLASKEFFYFVLCSGVCLCTHSTFSPVLHLEDKCSTPHHWKQKCSI